MVPWNGASPSRFVTRRNPVPASITRLGNSPSWANATDDVWPPYLTKSSPGAGVEPRTPHKNARMLFLHLGTPGGAPQADGRERLQRHTRRCRIECVEEFLAVDAQQRRLLLGRDSGTAGSAVEQPELAHVGRRADVGQLDRGAVRAGRLDGESPGNEDPHCVGLVTLLIMTVPAADSCSTAAAASRSSTELLAPVKRSRAPSNRTRGASRAT